MRLSTASPRLGSFRPVHVPVAAAIAATMLVAAPAAAQDVIPPPPPPPGQPAEPPPAPLGGAGSAADARYNDANVDRVILGSTAETHPKGTFFISDYELLLLQIGYAVTDYLQLQLTGIPPIIKQQPYWIEAGAKLNLYRSDVFRAAITGGLDLLTYGGSGTDNGPFYGGRLGAIGQFCLIPTCRSSVSLDVGTLLTSGANQALPIYGAIGGIFNVSKVISILAEPAMAGVLGTGAGNVGSGAFFELDYGIRISGPNFGGDIAFLLPLATTGGNFDNPFILGYPFVALTYRTDGDEKPPPVRSAMAPMAPMAPMPH
jgi:hypothetical protein